MLQLYPSNRVPIQTRTAYRCAVYKTESHGKLSLNAIDIKAISSLAPILFKLFWPGLKKKNNSPDTPVIKKYWFTEKLLQ